MKTAIPRKLALFGGLLITISGVVNAILGALIGAMLYEVYPGGNMGHVGILAGIGAVLVGLAIIFALPPLYRHCRRFPVFLGGLLTVVLGHIGAVWGALYVGTLGLLLCYIAGFWLIVVAIAGARSKRS